MSDEKKKETGENEMKVPIKEIVGGAIAVLTNKKVRKMVLGEYSDGSIRSLPDALSDETLSPKQKGKYKTKNKKNKKKKFKYE